MQCPRCITGIIHIDSNYFKGGCKCGLVYFLQSESYKCLMGYIKGKPLFLFWYLALNRCELMGIIDNSPMRLPFLPFDITLERLNKLMLLK